MNLFKKMILGAFLLLVLLPLEEIVQAKVDIEQEINRLKSPLFMERQHAILNLIQTPVPEIIPPIVSVLSDSDPDVRYIAAWALNPTHVNEPLIYDGTYISGRPQLTSSNSKEIVNALLNGFPEPNFWAHREMLQSLFRIQRYQKIKGIILDGKTREESLVQFKNPDPDIRAGAAQNMGLWKGDAVIETMLRQAFTEEVWRIRLSVLRYLKEDVNILSEAVLDPRIDVRMQAVEYLRKDHNNDPLKIDLLIQALQDPSLLVVFPAIEGLVSTKSDQAIIPLLLSEERMKRHNPGFEHIGKAIHKLTGSSIEVVKKAYQSKMEQFVLETRPLKKPNTDLLMRKLKSGQTSEILFAAKELPWDQSEYKMLLLEKITNANPRLRFAFLDELNTYISRNYIEPKEFESVFQVLTKATKDPNPHVRRMAIRGLQIFLVKTITLQKTRVIAFLKKVYQEEKDPFVTKHRILYYGHIFGTDPEAITLAPEFRTVP